MDTFPLGGIAKSLLALFNELKDRYDIDFLLMKQEGLFIPLIPNNVNLLEEPIEDAFRNPHPRYVGYAFKTLKRKRFIQWMIFSMRCSVARLTGGLHKMVCVMDISYAKLAESQMKHYDAAIAFQGGRCIYYIAENVDADKKIGYVHSDYSNNEIDYMMKLADQVYFPQMDYIVTISEKCLESLQKEFPEMKNQLKVIENISSGRMIHQLSLVCGGGYSDGWDGIRLVTMGRFAINGKGIDIIAESCRLLKDRKYKFKWYYLGDGEQRPQVEALIRDNGVEDVFILLGAKTNPYPYIREADIYVQPSRVEGKSVALDEAKILQKPIVVTRFSTVYDQFVDRENALIADISSKSVAEKIGILIENPKIRQELSENLKKESSGNEDQVKVFEKLIVS